MEPDYLPDFRGIFLANFGPQNPMGGCGGVFPPSTVARGEANWPLRIFFGKMPCKIS